jgi:hypothetical protein
LADVRPDLTNAEQAELVRRAAIANSTISMSPHMKRLRGCWRSSTRVGEAHHHSDPPKPVGEQSLLYRKLRAAAGGDDWLAAHGARLLNSNSCSSDRCFNLIPAEYRL